MIEVKDLHKMYGKLVALDGISFRLNPGEVLGFLGPNGAGKTTTMRILCGSLSASSGSVQVAGYDVFEKPIEVKKRIGYLPELPPLYDDLNVDYYLAFVARIKGVPKEQVAGKVEQVMNACNLKKVKSRRIGNLSKGFRQRLGLAQALINDPKVLILDEPTQGLDPNQILEIRNLIKQLSKKHTVILSTHILPEVVQICTRVIIIHQGCLVADNDLKELTDNGRTLEQTFHELTQH